MPPSPRIWQESDSVWSSAGRSPGRLARSVRLLPVMRSAGHFFWMFYELSARLASQSAASAGNQTSEELARLPGKNRRAGGWRQIGNLAAEIDKQQFQADLYAHRFPWHFCNFPAARKEGRHSSSVRDVRPAWFLQSPSAKRHALLVHCFRSIASHASCGMPQKSVIVWNCDDGGNISMMGRNAQQFLVCLGHPREWRWANGTKKAQAHERCSA